MRRAPLVIVLAGLLSGGALAQTATLMKFDELKARLFGIQMEGYAVGSGDRWRECIEPDGDTLYETPAGVLRGKLTISAQGQACFAYEDDGFTTPACFLTRRSGAGFRFEGGFGADFVTTKVVTGVRTCEKQDLIG